jgi:5'-nucleotidase
MRRALRPLAALAVALVAAPLAGAGRGVPQPPNLPVNVQILAVSDWHGQLDPQSITGVGNVGGAAVISSYWQADRAANPNTLTLTAGDAYGASPPLSSFFDEEPAVKAMNLMGFDADTLGNHNFDRGLDHLRRMIKLAEFDYVSANLENLNRNLRGVRPARSFNVDGVKVAVVGITNPEAPTLVTPGNFGPLEVSDPVAAANREARQARRMGASVVVAIAHLGMTGTNASGVATGPLRDFAEAVDGFDVILGDHTDFQFQGVINGALVVENKSKGVTYSRTQLTVDPKERVVTSASSGFVTPLASGVTPDPAIEAMLAPYRAELSAKLDGKIGEATALFPRANNIERLGEVAIGNLATDAMRISNGTQIAIVNGGGIRAPLPSAYLPADKSLRRNSPGYAAGPPFDLVIGDGYTVFPFGNAVLTRMISGAQLLAALELSVTAIPAANGRFLQISGFEFVYDSSRPVGARVVSATLDGGLAVMPGATYTVAMPDFVNAGGDGYTMFVDGQPYATRNLLAQAFNEHITANSPVTPVVEGRITNLATP